MTLFLMWLHLMAAIAWIGGMLFLSIVLVPVFKSEPFAPRKAPLIRTTGRRFRAVVWGSIAVLLITGPLLLHERGIRVTDPSGWPRVLVIKLGLVIILLLLTLAHDFILGPRVGQIMQLPMESRTRFDQALVLWSPWVARFSLILALVVLLAAVVLVRT